MWSDCPFPRSPFPTLRPRRHLPDNLERGTVHSQVFPTRPKPIQKNGTGVGLFDWMLLRQELQLMTRPYTSNEASAGFTVAGGLQALVQSSIESQAAIQIHCEISLHLMGDL